MTTKAKCNTLIAIGILGCVVGGWSSTLGIAFTGILIAIVSFTGAAALEGRFKS